uniref:Protein NYNRIN-like n=1 Tax=Tanacetum cinerariifolium TaxID=118510 RepID=A0A6L2P0P3_TANCI|nr:protein NYNRIN-like [Tanacetum cinerariifolium]
MEEGKFLGYIVTSKGIRANPKKTKAVMNMPSPRNLKQMQRLSGKLAALNRFLFKAAERALPCLDILKKYTMTEDNPTQVKTDGSDDTLAEGESMKEQEDTKTKTPENFKAKTNIWKLYIDGASNEHGSGAGLILIDPEGSKYSYALRLNFANSNNDAKYEALLAGIRDRTKAAKNDMIFVTSAWPFRKWGMDIVGTLPEAPGKIKYLIVAIDYFTKWLEAKLVTSITKKQVKNSTFDNIICRFGIPATIITDNRTQLINDPFKFWAEGLGMNPDISSSRKRSYRTR